MEMHEIPCGRFIDPFTDFGFKRIFGTDANKDVLIDFLNVLLAGERQIADLTYNRSENDGQIAANRRAIFDLCCTSTEGEQFIVEVQRSRQEHFRDRALYYISSLICDQAGAGVPDCHYELKPVYLIGLMEFRFHDSVPGEYLHHIRLTKKGSGELFYDKFGLTFIEMPAFNKTESELSSELDRRLYLLKNLSKLEGVPASMERPVFSKVCKIAEICNLNPIEKMAWDAYLKVKWDNESCQAYAEKEAMERGYEKGIEQGIEKGMEEGIEKGIEEGKLLTARNMKTRGFDIETISEITGLTIEEIQNA